MTRAYEGTSLLLKAHLEFGLFWLGLRSGLPSFVMLSHHRIRYCPPVHVLSYLSIANRFERSYPCPEWPTGITRRLIWRNAA